MVEITLVELSYDMTELEPQRAAADSEKTNTLKYSEITRTVRVGGDPPPPPSTPHPTVVAELRRRTVPEKKLSFGTKSQMIPLRLVAVLTGVNQKRIPQLLQLLADDATSCGGVEQFEKLVKRHAERINRLVAENRASAVGFCKQNKLSKKILHDAKFAFYKRLAVWREAVEDVLKLVSRSKEWTETRRNFLWRRLIRTNQFSWYGNNLPETFSLDSYLKN